MSLIPHPPLTHTTPAPLYIIISRLQILINLKTSLIHSWGRKLFTHFSHHIPGISWLVAAWEVTFTTVISTHCCTSYCSKSLMQTSHLREGQALYFLAKTKHRAKCMLLCSASTKYSLRLLKFVGLRVFII